MIPLPIKHSKDHGDCIFIDNSTLEFLDTCPRSFEYFYLLKRQSSEERSALNFGGGVHAALARRYSAPQEFQDFVSNTPLEQEMFDSMTEYFQDHPLELSDFRQPSLARMLVQGYNERYQSEPFTVLEQQGEPLVEFPFALHLCSLTNISLMQQIKVFYTGKIDLVVAEGNQIFTVDHKTTSMMGDGFWMEQRVNPQHEGYCWAWWQATGTPPDGYIVNGIRTRKPLVRDANGESKRSKRKDVEEDDFQRDKVYVDIPRLEEWKRNLVHKLETVMHYVHREYFPMHKKWCVGKYGACQYYDVCSLAQEFREPTLQSGAFKDVTWSPLDKKEGEVKPVPDSRPKLDWDTFMEEPK